MIKWIWGNRIRGVIALIGIAAMLAVLLLNYAAVSPDSLVGKLGDLILIGNSNAVYASEPDILDLDFLCDGIDDDVQFQDALDGLPVRGGRIRVLGGEYNFSATVLRAIDNVTIEGVGKSTYFGYDNVTPIFDAGVQDAWVFSMFATDNGGVDIATATDYHRFMWINNVWTCDDCGGGAGVTDHDLLNNLDWSNADHVIDTDVDFDTFEAVAMSCDQGGTFPVGPVLGQWFLHTLTGRSILYMYDGSTWQSLFSVGDMTLYVDGADGTDNRESHGFGVDGDAFDTIQFAVDTIPPIFGGQVQINVAAGTYTEKVSIGGKTPSASDHFIVIEGNRNHSHFTAVAGSVAGTGSTRGTIVCAAATFVADDSKYKFARFDDGTATAALQGMYKPIITNSTTTVTIAGTWQDSAPYVAGTAPANGDTFTIFSCDSIIDGNSEARSTVQIGGGQENVIFRFMKMQHSATSTYCIDNAPYGFDPNNPMYGDSTAVFQGCYVDSQAAFNVTIGNTMHIQACVVECFYNQANGGALTVFNSFVWKYTAGTPYLFMAFGDGTIHIKAGTTLRGDANKLGYGVHASAGSYVYTYSAPEEGYPYIAGFAVGCGALQTSSVTGTSSNQYTDGAIVNTANETATAASYGYID